MTESEAESLERHPESDRLARAVEKGLAHRMPWSGVIYRATGIDYANDLDLISGLGSKLHGARWTPRYGFAAVYGSLDPHSALIESLGTGGRYGIPYEERMPLVMVALDVELDRVLDLTLPVVRRILRMSLTRMLEEDWQAHQIAGREAITQAVARTARTCNVQALFVPSARLRNARNMVLFPGLFPSSGLRIQNVQKLPAPNPRGE